MQGFFFFPTLDSPSLRSTSMYSFVGIIFLFLEGVKRDGAGGSTQLIGGGSVCVYCSRAVWIERINRGCPIECAGPGGKN